MFFLRMGKVQLRNRFAKNVCINTICKQITLKEDMQLQ